MADIKEYATREANNKRLEKFKIYLATRVAKNDNRHTGEPIRAVFNDNMSQFFVPK